MPTVTIPLSAFVASGGVVAFDRLKVEILGDGTITSTYFDGLPSLATPGTSVDLFFEDPLTAPQSTALDGIIAAHNGENLPLGTEFITNHTILNSGAVAAQAVSFVDATFSLMGALDERNQRSTDGAGRLIAVAVENTVGANITVQRIGNGVLVGAGVTIDAGANGREVFSLPLSEGLYAQAEDVGIALTGLPVGSDTAIDALWEEVL